MFARLRPARVAVVKVRPRNAPTGGLRRVDPARYSDWGLSQRLLVIKLLLRTCRVVIRQKECFCHDASTRYCPTPWRRGRSVHRSPGAEAAPDNRGTEFIIGFNEDSTELTPRSWAPLARQRGGSNDAKFVHRLADI